MWISDAYKNGYNYTALDMDKISIPHLSQKKKG